MKRVVTVAALLMSTTAFAGTGVDPDMRGMNKELSGPDAREMVYEKMQLVSNQEHNYSFRARAGVTYKAYGDCDSNCMDLDLAVIDSRGVMLEADTELDDVPLFSWTAPSSGTYTFRTRMVKCDAHDCDATLNIYETRD